MCIHSVGFTRLTKGMSTVITGLEPSEEYYVEITSMNINGNSKPFSTTSKKIETTMSNAKRAGLSILAGFPTLGLGIAPVLQATQEADDEDMCVTDEEYEP